MGNNSLKFIALLARGGWSDEAIRVMYDYALHTHRLSSNKESTWLEVEEWYINGNRSSQ